jgi:hypothetical protein
MTAPTMAAELDAQIADFRTRSLATVIHHASRSGCGSSRRSPARS